MSFSICSDIVYQKKYRIFLIFRYCGIIVGFMLRDLSYFIVIILTYDVYNYSN